MVMYPTKSVNSRSVLLANDVPIVEGTGPLIWFRAGDTLLSAVVLAFVDH